MPFASHTRARMREVVEASQVIRPLDNGWRSHLEGRLGKGWRLPPVPLPAVALEPEQQVGSAVTAKGYPQSGFAHMLPTVRDPEVNI